METKSGCLDVGTASVVNPHAECSGLFASCPRHNAKFLPSNTPFADELRALRARVAELEAQNAEISTEARNLAYALEAADERQAEADKKLLDVHDSLHRECNGPVDLGREIRDMRSALEQRVGDLRKMYEKAEAQVAAARAEYNRPHTEECTSDECSTTCPTPDSIIRAMDEAAAGRR